MYSLQRHKIIFKLMAIFVLLVFASSTFSAGLSTNRIIPKGKVSLYNGSQKIGEFTSEAPLLEDVLISVQGKCGVKMNNLYLVAVDKSLFSITTTTDSRILSVEQGTLFFALSSMPHTLVFQTPGSVITTHEILINASADAGLLKGYVSVEDDATKVGVFEGGSILLTVGDGKAMRIKSGQELKLAQADLFKDAIPEEVETAPSKETVTPEAAPETTATEAAPVGTVGGISTTTLALGLGSLALVGGVAAAGGGGGGGGGGPSSPSTP